MKPTSIIDMRSDTMTKPTPAMREAMAKAEVGDDVYSEDPTVNRLEALAAEMLGFDTGLFMPSGSMTNQVGLMLHVKRGSEVIATKGAHIYEYEPGSLAVLSGGMIRIVDAPYGIPNPAEIKYAIHHSIHQAPTSLISLENTHNYSGGTVVPIEIQREVQDVANAAGLPVHLDGARFFNAVTALHTTPIELAKGFRTISICLSKGLGAPVGSILLMPKEYRAEAWRYRKLVGGGMRQAGVLAAAGLIALQEGPKQLGRDHQMARALAEGMLAQHIEIDLQSVQTNMVYAHVPDAEGFASRLRDLGLLINPASATRVRFVTHRDLRDEDIPAALNRIEQALQLA